jgi:phospholipase/carboxylesterase
MSGCHSEATKRARNLQAGAHCRSLAALGMTRREFVATLGASAAVVLTGCLGDSPTIPGDGDATLKSRPGTPTQTIEPGLHDLGLGGTRDGKLFVPQSYTPTTPLPLLVLFHGATGAGANWFGSYDERAEALGCAVLAPDSRFQTWDVILGAFNEDIAFIDTALAHTFDRVAVDPARIVMGGFSDGATYALSAALPNADFVSQVIGYSPGFFVKTLQRGAPEVFLSHGRGDPVLSEDNTRLNIRARLQELGCEVEYVSFQGGHEVPDFISTRALEWLQSSWAD